MVRFAWGFIGQCPWCGSSKAENLLLDVRPLFDTVILFKNLKAIRRYVIVIYIRIFTKAFCVAYINTSGSLIKAVLKFSFEEEISDDYP